MKKKQTKQPVITRAIAFGRSDATVGFAGSKARGMAKSCH